MSKTRHQNFSNCNKVYASVTKIDFSSYFKKKYTNKKRKTRNASTTNVHLHPGIKFKAFRQVCKVHILIMKKQKGTCASTPSHEETIASLPEASSPNVNLTDLSIGKTDPSPAFSRLTYHLEGS